MRGRHRHGIAPHGRLPTTRPARAGLLWALLGMLALTGCATSPPGNVRNLCAVFSEHPDWYDYAKAAERTWGTPAHILMAFVRFESGFRSHARPPRQYALGFIPWGRISSAYGYGQIKDPVWGEYRSARGGLFRSRNDMADVLDFIGWYNHLSAQRLGLSKWDPKNLYLAYHEGHAGYRSGRWRGKPALLRYADRVDHRAREYGAQLRRCESRFRCDGWLEFWPFCGA